MPQTPEHRQVVTTGKAAKLLGDVSPTTVRHMCEDGTLEGAYRVGKWWRVPLQSIDKVKGTRERE